MLCGLRSLVCGALLFGLVSCSPKSKPKPEPAPVAEPAPVPDPRAEPQAEPEPEASAPPLVAPFEHFGCAWTEASSRFRVFAPAAASMELLLFDTLDAGAAEAHPMNPTRDRAFQVEVPGNHAHRSYLYRITYNDGTRREVLDPWATCTVRSSSRALILPEDDEAHRPDGPVLASPTDAIIYEMHVRDFTIDPNAGIDPHQRGRYLGWTRTDAHHPRSEKLKTTIAHLKELGVTHVQILPVQDFENNEYEASYNWGYMTLAHFAPEGAYATNTDGDQRVRELKQLIDTLHAEGIGVILDVVYNHTAWNAPFKHLGHAYFYRHWPDGTPANGSACGNDLRTEAPVARRYIVESLEHWVREYKVDGFRFDMMGLMDVATMQALEARLRALRPDVLIYGEPWALGDSPIDGQPCARDGIKKLKVLGAFNDYFRNALKGQPEHPDQGFIQGGHFKDGVEHGIAGQQSWDLAPGRLIQYMTCHDGWTLVDKFDASMPDIGQRELVQRSMLGYLLLFTAQGVPFLHGGEEFLRSKQGEHNSYDRGDEINMIRWDLKYQQRHHYSWVRAMIKMRRAHPVFRLPDHAAINSRLRFHHSEKPNVLMFSLRGSGLAGETWNEALVVVNVHAQDTLALDLPDGTWKLHLSTDPQWNRLRRPVRDSLELPPLFGAVYFR